MFKKNWGHSNGLEVILFHCHPPGEVSGIKDRTNGASQPGAKAAGRHGGQLNAMRWQRLSGLWEETHRTPGAAPLPVPTRAVCRRPEEQGQRGGMMVNPAFEHQLKSPTFKTKTETALK